MTSNELEARRAEFRRFVWNHSEDQFQAEFDRRPPLQDDEVHFVLEILCNHTTVPQIALATRRMLAKNPEHYELLLQLSGLTRNKILQDIKAHARNNDLDVSFSSGTALFSSKEGARLASEYIARQLFRVFGHAQGACSKSMLESISQATWPGYVRQERAKRMGHEAERRLASLLLEVGLPFAPVEKATNPLCRDIQIDGISYDLVSPDSTKPLVVVKSTVHTANIGQYGESKDDLEMRTAREAINRVPQGKRPLLIAFVDGVGFESNRAGLDGVLSTADEFCQFRTIWKAAAIVAFRLGKETGVATSADVQKTFARFGASYGVRFSPLQVGGLMGGWVQAGDAQIRVL